jgi:hypothetical protein
MSLPAIVTFPLNDELTMIRAPFTLAAALNPAAVVTVTGALDIFGTGSAGVEYAKCGERPARIAEMREALSPLVGYDTNPAYP